MTLEEQLKSISDSELAEKSESTLNKLCKTGGRSFTMAVPPSLEDTDMLFSEVIERFKNLTTKHFI